MDEKESLQTIIAIAKRAEELDLLLFNRMSLIMDLRTVHEQHNLDLSRFLNSDKINFTHDILGIQSNMDRQAKKLVGYFLPRFSTC